jgi:hypothetical protein
MITAGGEFRPALRTDANNHKDDQNARRECVYGECAIINAAV